MRRAAQTAIETVGGAVPVTGAEFGLRAAATAIAPRRNPLKRLMDSHTSPASATSTLSSEVSACPYPAATVCYVVHPSPVELRSLAEVEGWTMPPTLGLFMDTPWHQVTTAQVKAVARAGFLWVVADGEHLGVHGRYGPDQFDLFLRHGITPIQRLPREALSDHGDALALGARATMMPYGTSLTQVEAYLETVCYPAPPTDGEASSHCRGGYPVRDASGALVFDAAALVSGEGVETQGCVQFETAELLTDRAQRDAVLDAMAAKGPNRVFGFVGALDASLRIPGGAVAVAEASAAVGRAAMQRGVHMGKLCGGPPTPDGIPDPAATEEAMVEAIKGGYRMIGLSVLSSDLHYMGAATLARPFWAAAARCGF